VSLSQPPPNNAKKHKGVVSKEKVSSSQPPSNNVKKQKGASSKQNPLTTKQKGASL